MCSPGRADDQCGGSGQVNPALVDLYGVVVAARIQTLLDQIAAAKREVLRIVGDTPLPAGIEMP